MPVCDSQADAVRLSITVGVSVELLSSDTVPFTVAVVVTLKLKEGSEEREVLHDREYEAVTLLDRPGENVTVKDLVRGDVCDAVAIRDWVLDGVGVLASEPLLVADADNVRGGDNVNEPDLLSVFVSGELNVRVFEGGGDRVLVGGSEPDFVPDKVTSRVPVAVA